MNHRRYSVVVLLLSFFLLAAPLPGRAARNAPAEAAQSLAAPAVSVAAPSSVNDGVAFVCALSAPDLQSVTASFLGRSITAAAVRAGDTHTVTLLFPVPLDHAQGVEHLSWSALFPDGSRRSGTTPVTISRKAYPVQELRLDPKYVTPDPSLAERIERERRQLDAALSARSAARRWELPLLRPVPGSITSLFGLRRVLNGQPRSPHKGLDFRAAAGDPIACVADGTVVLTGDFYYPGQFAVVDHGLGVTSIYMHLSAIVAEKGRAIKKGEIVGLAGSTGRATGPHLHLGFTVLGLSVDAFPLLDTTAEDKALYAEAFSGAAKAGTSGAGKKIAAPKAATAKKQPASGGGAKSGGRDKGKKQGTKQ